MLTIGVNFYIYNQIFPSPWYGKLLYIFYPKNIILIVFIYPVIYHHITP
jgi:hypothetical protein